MSRSESAEIQSQGGKASAEKRRTVRKIKDILKGVRAQYDVDPVERLVVSIFQETLAPTSRLNDKLKTLECIQRAMGETNDRTKTTAEFDEEKQQLREQLRKQIAEIPGVTFD